MLPVGFPPTLHVAEDALACIYIDVFPQFLSTLRGAHHTFCNNDDGMLLATLHAGFDPFGNFFDIGRGFRNMNSGHLAE